MTVSAKARAIFARIKATLARREARRIACAKLADDVKVRKMLVGTPYEKRRAAQKAVR